MSKMQRYHVVLKVACKAIVSAKLFLYHIPPLLDTQHSANEYNAVFKMKTKVKNTEIMPGSLLSSAAPNKNISNLSEP